MQVTVRFYGNYRRLMNAPEVTLEVGADATPLAVVYALAGRYGEGLRAALLSEGRGAVRLKPGVRMAVGDEVIDSMADLEKPLALSAAKPATAIEVFVFPPLMGGGR